MQTLPCICNPCLFVCLVAWEVSQTAGLLRKHTWLSQKPMLGPRSPQTSGRNTFDTACCWALKHHIATGISLKVLHFTSGSFKAGPIGSVLPFSSKKTNRIIVRPCIPLRDVREFATTDLLSDIYSVPAMPTTLRMNMNGRKPNLSSWCGSHSGGLWRCDRATKAYG